MPSCALSRRDPPNGKNGFSKTKGFTVIEMMIAVAVLAIITSLALPSYRALLEKRQVTSGAQQLAAFLSSAQLEAVKRNENVKVSYVFSDVDDWCLVMVLGETECNCVLDSDSLDIDIDASTTCLFDDGIPRAFTPANLKISPDNVGYKGSLSGIPRDGSYVIDPVRGMMVDGGGLVDVSGGIQFEFTSVPQGIYALNAEISPTGRVSICSATDRADRVVPGYDEC